MSRNTLYSMYMHLHLSSSHGDRWGTTDLATLYLILFLDSLSASQKFNPVHSEMLFSQCSFIGLFFSLLALLLVKCSWQALLTSIHTPATLTCVSLPCVVKLLSWGPMACPILSALLVKQSISSVFLVIDEAKEKYYKLGKVKSSAIYFK